MHDVSYFFACTFVILQSMHKLAFHIGLNMEIAEKDKLYMIYFFQYIHYM